MANIMDYDLVSRMFPLDEQCRPYADTAELLSKLNAYVALCARGATADETTAVRRYLLTRQAMTPNAVFYALCSSAGLDEFSVFCLSGALYRFFYPTRALCLEGGYPLLVPDAVTPELLARIFYGDDLDPVSVYPRVANAVRLLRPILRAEEGKNPLTVPLEADQALVDYLYNPARVNHTLAQLGEYVQGEQPPRVLVNGELLEQFCAACQGSRPFVLLKGAAGAGKRFFVRHATQRLGLSGYFLDAKRLFLGDRATSEALLWEAEREARLSPLFLAITDLDGLEEVDAAYLSFQIERLRQSCALLVVTAADLDYAYPVQQELPLTIALPTPDAGERRRLFEQFAQISGVSLAAELQPLANKFLFTPGRVTQTLAAAEALAKREGSGVVTDRHLMTGAYSQTSHQLNSKATLLQTRFRLEDVILEQKEKQKLRDACAQVKNRHTVYEEWGYNQKLAYGRGTSMLFYGPPGTGKTMAASAIANELGLEIYRVDISKIVDKYIGETEKNIGFIFQQARECSAVLFFDEADALFATRSTVNSSHDRNANMETGFLLQCVENYDGISVLATNLKQNIDAAFLRRIKFFVEFPLPDLSARKQLWHACIPQVTPLEEEIDFDFLAQSLELSGGSIKNISLNAAFLAAEQGGGLTMSALINSAWQELQKEQSVLSPNIFGPYARLLRL